MASFRMFLQFLYFWPPSKKLLFSNIWHSAVPCPSIYFSVFRLFFFLWTYFRNSFHSIIFIHSLNIPTPFYWAFTVCVMTSVIHTILQNCRNLGKRPRGKGKSRSTDNTNIGIKRDHTYLLSILFWLRDTSLRVKMYQLSFRLFICAFFFSYLTFPLF